MDLFFCTIKIGSKFTKAINSFEILKKSSHKFILYFFVFKEGFKYMCNLIAISTSKHKRPDDLLYYSTVPSISQRHSKL